MRLLPKILLWLRLLRERRLLLAEILLRQSLPKTGRRRDRQTGIWIEKYRLIIELRLCLKGLSLLSEKVACLLSVYGGDQTSQR